MYPSPPSLSTGNIFQAIPEILDEEVFEDIVRAGNLRIERILSRGHASPENGWYDQDEHEWVVVLQGRGKLLFEGGPEVDLLPGDYVHIPAHRRHRVTWTDPDVITVWLAVFYA